MKSKEVFSNEIFYVIVDECESNYARFTIYENGTIAKVMSGSIKWDHCSDWNANLCIHFCEPEEIHCLSDIIEKCYQYAKDNVLNYDID